MSELNTIRIIPSSENAFLNKFWSFNNIKTFESITITPIEYDKLILHAIGFIRQLPKSSAINGIPNQNKLYFTSLNVFCRLEKYPIPAMIAKNAGNIK